MHRLAVVAERLLGEPFRVNRIAWRAPPTRSGMSEGRRL